MNHNSSPNGETAETEAATPVPAASAYEAPAIESVVTSDDLQREVLYAGLGSSTPPNPPGT